MTDTATSYRAVLIYDGDCPFCSTASSALRRLEDVGTVEWSDDAAQRFLAAQFGHTPFALVFVDSVADRVWTGREAARELCERAGLPVLIRDVVGDNYEQLADAVRRLSGADDDPEEYHGTYSLTDEAAEIYTDLADNARQTHRVGHLARDGSAGRSRSLSDRIDDRT